MERMLRHMRINSGAGTVQGKSFIVTGAAKGIGRARAELLVASGAQVMFTDLDINNEEAAVNPPRQPTLRRYQSPVESGVEKLKRGKHLRGHEGGILMTRAW